ncbi:hypothetical protein HYPSUDRAFT_68825 [Hypholoma sublateritium FD-334 SS-4]|uniref:Uncharacterized protein n=1 Tax=Hypholoma sublateritium (strain FD-334 SS-4) TaxID=945553 RepID=A0A0D2NMG8_HYPSF|nr:hypothetical protein HYPSUDRAFT_68825 [Hypholoma sublateritium FD-334 SS-4]
MSVVSSVLSTRSSGWKISARLSSFMDSIFAIAFGLGLRVVVDAVSHHDFKLTGTLVGLWEGIILLHFLKKMPKSTDPYVAYGVRLFIDFLLTDSVARLVLVLIWTALGMVLADITPAIWDDVGLNRIWRHFRRDIYTMTQMIPTVAFFPPARTVRFSPSRAPSVIMEEPSVLDTQTPSDITTEHTITTPITIPVTITTTPAAHRRRVPGHFSGGFSDTDTDLGSVRAGPSTGRTSRRLSVYPQQQDYEDSVTDLSSNNDLDEANLSSGGSSLSTERGDPSSVVIDPVGIPDMEEEAAPLVLDTAAVAAAVKNEEGDQTTPRAAPMYLPPTPSDSAVRWRPNLEPEEPLPVRLARPFAESLPQIPDFLEEPTTEDWETIQPQEYADKPPTPPAKDDLPARFAVPPVPTMPPPQPPQVVPPAPAPVTAMEDDWETLKGNFVAPADHAAAAPSGTGHEKRLSEPPSYKESAEFDDIYGEEYVPEPRLDEAGPNDIYDSNATGAPPPTNLLDDGDVAPLGDPFTFTYSQADSKNPRARATAPAAGGLDEFVRQQQDDEARLQQERDAKAAEEKEEREQAEAAAVAAVAAAAAAAEEEEAAKRVLEAQAAEAKRKQEEEAETVRLAQEAEAKRKQEEEDAEKERIAQDKQRKRDEKAERKRKEEADELARQQKREEEAAETKRLEAEEAAKKLEEKKKKAEEKKLKKAADAEAKKAAEAEAARVAAEEEKEKQEEAAEQRRKDAEDAAARRQAALIAKEEAERQEKEAAAAQEAKEVKEATERQEREAAAAQAANEAKEKELEDAETAKATQAALDAAAALGAETRAQEEHAAAATTPEGAGETQQPTPDTSEETQGAERPPVTPRNNPNPLDTEENSGDAQKTPVGSHQVLDNPVKPSEETPAPVDPEATHIPEAEAGDVATGEERAPGSPAIAESIITDASEVPGKVADRLDRLLLLKAQIVGTQDIIAHLKQKLSEPEQDATSLSDELKRTEKILKKMERKEQRRHEAVEQYYLGDDDHGDLMLFSNNTPPREAGLKTEEKLEEMLKPGITSFGFTLQMAAGSQKKSNGPKQKAKVVELLQDYGLFDYTKEDANNGRIMHVKVSEGKFRQWLIDYRAKATAAAEDDENIYK